MHPADLRARLRRLAPWTAAAAVAVAVADLVTNWMAAAQLPAYHMRWLLGGVVGLDSVRHVVPWSAAALLQALLGATFALGLAMVGAWNLSRRLQTAVALLSGAVLGGLIGNGVERVRDGYVVDWLRLSPTPQGNMVVNLADIAIVLGAIVASILVLRCLARDQPGLAARR